MPTLHIEHTITDLATWQVAFGRLAAARAAAGVRSQRVQQPVDDDHFIVIDLDFDTVEAARAFLQFLRSQVWASAESSPALAGEQHTLILQTCGQ